MLTVGIEFMTTENKYKMKYIQIAVQMTQIYKVRQPNEVVSDQLFHGDFFHYVNPKNKDGLTPLHMATVNIQSFKHVNIVLQIKIQK